MDNTIELLKDRMEEKVDSIKVLKSAYDFLDLNVYIDKSLRPLLECYKTKDKLTFMHAMAVEDIISHIIIEPYTVEELLDIAITYCSLYELFEGDYHRISYVLYVYIISNVLDIDFDIINNITKELTKNRLMEDE